jgi:hypothetical protein
MEEVVGSKNKIGHKWVKGDRKPRKDGMTQALQDLVFKWWLEETQVSLRKCNVVRKITPITSNGKDMQVTFIKKAK